MQVVHVAGTKGKGSTAAFLSNILRAEGYSVGCYTRYFICPYCFFFSTLSISERARWLYLYTEISLPRTLNSDGSPHIRTIRECMCVGTQDKPVSKAILGYTFHRIKKTLDQAVAHELGFLSHFEVSSCLVF